MNLVLSVTEGTFSYHSEATAACGFERRVLCDLNQLQDAVDIGGEVPEFKWGWFSIEDRAATLENCDPGTILRCLRSSLFFTTNIIFSVLTTCNNLS